MIVLTQLWRYLTTPDPTITAPQDRRRVRLIMGMLVFIIPLMLIGLFFGDGWQDPRIPQTLLLVCALLIAYRLSYTRYYLISASLIVTGIIILPFFEQYFPFFL